METNKYNASGLFDVEKKKSPVSHESTKFDSASHQLDSQMLIDRNPWPFHASTQVNTPVIYVGGTLCSGRDDVERVLTINERKRSSTHPYESAEVVMESTCASEPKRIMEHNMKFLNLLKRASGI